MPLVLGCFVRLRLTSLLRARFRFQGFSCDKHDNNAVHAIQAQRRSLLITPPRAHFSFGQSSPTLGSIRKRYE